MVNMAISRTLFFSVFVTLITISAARNKLILSDNDVGHVCNPSRFAKLGMDITKFAYCNSSLPYEVRAKDLVDRMTLGEKVQQVGNKASGVARIGLPKYEWWSEALHGVSNVGPGTYFDDVVPGATSFPTVILTAASFNQSLWKSIGEAVSTEARAMYNIGRAGLTYWSPNINVVRDPRWGRTLETPGEDPFVVGTYATNYVRGLQDVKGSEDATDLNSRPLKVASCCKHYAAYDVDAWNGIDRYHFNAKVAEQDMMETFLRPFEMCVKDGDVASVMCSYNRVNGIPTCADSNLLKGIIRGKWNLHGYIVSDCDSLEVIVDDHKWLGDTKEEASAQALKAGLDLDCGSYYTDSLENSVSELGLVREAEIDTSLKYLYIVLMRLGFFDGNPSFQSLGKADVCSPQHLELAVEAAREGIVLLKNDENFLPLDSTKFDSLAIVGPHGNATTDMIGNYAGVPCKIISPLDAFSGLINKKVSYAMGCTDVLCKDDALIFNAVQSSKNSDVTLLFVGLSLKVEAESLDRENLLLPGHQTQLINQVAQSANGPVILVIMSAGGVDITFAKENPKIKSILWAGYPGEKGGSAILDVVLGKYNPGGRLPVTWYEADYVNKLPMTSMPLRPIDSLKYPGRTYKFYNGSTVYPFAYGLSYTQFKYEIVSSTNKLDVKLGPLQQCHALNFEDPKFNKECPAAVVDELSCEDIVSLQVSVKNVGPKDGSEVVVVYSRPPKGIVGTPIKQVIGFQRVFVAAGGSQNVNFELNLCKSFNLIDVSAYNLLPSGSHTIEVGDNSLFSTTLQLNFVH